jgi:hypothetical protein
MCHYITATLPHVVEPDSVANIFESHKLGFELISNPHVAEQVNSPDWYILTSRNHCDCGTAFGSLNHRDTAAKGSSYDRELKKFRKQGWSEAKMQRWLEQKEQTKERHRRKDEDLVQGGSPELDRWIELLNELIGSGPAPRVGLLLHWYHGSIEGERIKIQRRERVRLSEVNPERLMKIEEDVLYEVVP